MLYFYFINILYYSCYCKSNNSWESNDGSEKPEYPNSENTISDRDQGSDNNKDSESGVNPDSDSNNNWESDDGSEITKYPNSEDTSSDSDQESDNNKDTDSDQGSDKDSESGGNQDSDVNKKSSFEEEPSISWDSYFDGYDADTIAEILKNFFF